MKPGYLNELVNLIVVMAGGGYVQLRTSNEEAGNIINGWCDWKKSGGGDAAYYLGNSAAFLLSRVDGMYATELIGPQERIVQAVENATKQANDGEEWKDGN